MKFLLTTFAFLSLLFPVLSSAATYPASCPTEAQAIVEAVGGCSAVDKDAYDAIYSKCCSVGKVIPVTTTTPVTPDTRNSNAGAWLLLIVWGSLVAWIYKRFWKEERLAIWATKTMKERSEVVAQIGFWKFVLIYGVLLIGNVFAILLLAVMSANITITADMYVPTLIGGLVFGFISGTLVWLVFTLYHKFKK